ncbi:MAG: LamG domain-containing protein [Desulfarculaceae bacterium]|nr:LamG domain-containing protein [Desulfarculaceae bacterium]
MRAKTLIILLLAALFLAGPVPAARAAAAPSLLDGLYQPADAAATALVAAQPDGSLIMRLWQGGDAVHHGGFAYMGRLVPDAQGKRLAGSWQALPGSCCPGRGRQEIEVLGPESFRFASFAPSLDRTAWPGDSAQVFRRVAGPPSNEPAQRLGGQWNVTYWYNGLLPNGAPADLNRGSLSLSPIGGDALQGTWPNHPGTLTVLPSPGGATLAYADPEARFELNAQLAEEAGGLTLAGVFTSTLGKGQMVLTRKGLPASPPGPQIAQEGNLSGLWVDQRTGSDFYKITGSDNGFSFLAYGGDRNQPRYLSKGAARPDGPGRLSGTAKDQEGYCCGNQGQFGFRQVGPDQLEVIAYWWPQGQPRPQNLRPETFVIQRSADSKTDMAATPAGWPQTVSSRPDLPAAGGGSLQVLFKPREQSGAAQTLFSEGGYSPRLELYLTPEGQLAALIDTAQGPVELRSSAVAEPGRDHAAWLIWQAGGEANLYLDATKVASAPLPEPWTGTEAPYLVGGSRWPGRGFSGDIDEVRLWASAQNPDEAEPPRLTITPGAAQPAKEPAARAEAPTTRQVMRLWHPSLLRHAYATTPEAVKGWQAKGYRLQGPIARLWTKPVTGSHPLWAYQHESGYMLISPKPDPPAGCSSLGILGYAPEEAGPGRVELYGLEAAFPDPLRGSQISDRLFATDHKTLERAKQAGYGQPAKVSLALPPAKQAAFAAPVLYTWAGSWRGEGWGRFFLQRRGNELIMFWYYADMKGPKFYGRYQIAPDGKSAEGVAVGQPGPKARFYRHRLVFDTQAQAGPRLSLTSWRMAAPLDDGRLVLFTKPRASQTLLIKAAQALPAKEGAIVEKLFASPNPRALYDQAVAKAKAAGRLLER